MNQKCISGIAFRCTAHQVLGTGDRAESMSKVEYQRHKPNAQARALNYREGKASS